MNSQFSVDNPEQNYETEHVTDFDFGWLLVCSPSLLFKHGQKSRSFRSPEGAIYGVGLDASGKSSILTAKNTNDFWRECIEEA